MGKDKLIEILKQFALNKNRNWVTQKEFCAETGISLNQILRHFPRWNDAVQAAGLSPLDKRGRPDVEKGYSREELLQKVREVAKSLGKDILTEAEFTKITKVSYRPIHRLFGDWQKFLSEAGLQIHPLNKQKIPDSELFDDYLRVVKETGLYPSYSQFHIRSKYSKGVYENRFNGFKNFRKLAIQHGINSGVIEPSFALEEIDNTPSIDVEIKPTYKPLNDRPILGEHLDFRGLLHAPVNEMGVVYLFGMLSEELGFVIEAIQAAFPDCEGKRKIEKGRWQRIRIEFEYLSSNFLRHGHDVNNCDVIICWIHDWNNCPIEVISLREYVLRQKR